jgi:hypothetical protein
MNVSSRAVAALAAVVLAGAATTTVAAATPRTAGQTVSAQGSAERATPAGTSRWLAPRHASPAGAHKAAAVPVKTRFTLLTADNDEGTTVDVGPTGPSVGDSDIWTNHLLDKAGRPVGHAHTECVYHVAYGSDDPKDLESSCNIAFVLENVGGKKAQLFAEGHFIDSGAFPVTGTGGFRYARGQVTLGAKPDTQGRFAWTFDLKVK